MCCITFPPFGFLPRFLLAVTTASVGSIVSVSGSVSIASVSVGSIVSVSGSIASVSGSIASGVILCFF